MIEADRLVSPDSVINAEEVADRAIRPKLLAEYVGQPQVRSQMEILSRRRSCVVTRWILADIRPSRTWENHPGEYRR
jgi:hypothetical protein